MDKEEILSQILLWSSQAGLQATRIDDPSADLHIIVSEPNLPNIDILHLKPDIEFLIFASRVITSEEHQRKLLSLNGKQRSEFYSKIKLRLLSTSLEYRMVGAESGVVSSYEIYFKFFPKNNTAQSFWRTYVLLKNIALFIASMHQEL
jgi:hypothetical protein